MSNSALKQLLDKYPLEKIGDKLKKGNEQLEFLLNYSLKEFVILSTRLKDYYSNVKEYFTVHYDEGQLVEIRNKFLESVNELIIDLQFHDIIRQKLEHIKQVHNWALSEMAEDKLNLGASTFVAVLPEISVLHTNQLAALKEEYDIATFNIKQALRNIIDQEAAASALGFDSRDSIKHAEEFNDVVERLASELKQLTSYVVPSTKISIDSSKLKKLEKIESLYSMKSERDVFNNLFRDGVTEEDEEDIELF